jgi:hypothetical protein
MQRALHCLQNWCGEIRLNVNADKTYMILFTKRRNFEGFFGVDTEQSGKISSKLNCKFHIDNRIPKASIVGVMGSEAEGGVLDMHFGNKTDFDICRISLMENNASDHCKKTVWSYPAD